MLDEPVRTVRDIERICSHGSADIVNQHPNCQGGPDFLADGQRIAHAAGLENMIGGITGYFGIGDLSYYSVAAAIGTGFVEQTPTQMYQGIRLSRNPHPIVEGKVTLDTTITGCGVELDREMLKRVLVERVSLGV
jgi:L-alanine-DL-glutamate epimerase-like enolase superfamily enzyme